MASLLALLCGAVPSLAAPGVPCSFYGVAAPASFNESVAAAVASSGVGSVRIDMQLGGGDEWSEERLAAYAAVFDAARSAGLEPVAVLGTGVVPSSQAAWNDDGDGDGNNAFVEAFASTSASLVERFATRVSRWEVWLAPNCYTNPGYASQPQAAGCTYLLPRVFGTMMSEVYRRVRVLVDAGAVSLVSGGLLTDEGGPFFSGEDYLDELYAQPLWDDLEASTGRRYPWDRLGVQLYVNENLPTDGAVANAYLDSLRNLAGERGDASRFMITEVGWSSLLLGESLQAENLSVTYGLLASRNDVAGVSWAMFRDVPAADLYYGLVDPNGAAKEALGAMQAAAQDCTADAGEGGGTSVSVGGSGPAGGGLSTTGGAQADPRGGGGQDSCGCTAAGAGERRWWAVSVPFVLGIAFGARRWRRTPRLRDSTTTP
ncbi:hypothetical protein [Chondromyces crocatus]|uniref:Glycoside hydrolase family 5 domain-containing protein n=1 Tax=Chondromyces crocatus TaxID=52 RepID=A0A0K1E4Y4_CHOCO|nr:hypothetical protein [Chondromyces crocatus]AKT35941.1 uncharacterized protein CMC5_000530 [Chondromyces crocatus]